MLMCWNDSHTICSVARKHKIDFGALELWRGGVMSNKNLNLLNINIVESGATDTPFVCRMLNWSLIFVKLIFFETNTDYTDMTSVISFKTILFTLTRQEQ